jgi:hypothetical protein
MHRTATYTHTQTNNTALYATTESWLATLPQIQILPVPLHTKVLWLLQHPKQAITAPRNLWA